MASPCSSPILRCLAAALALPGILSTKARAEALTFTITANEPVRVTGQPRLAIDVGGVTRHAIYVSGTGTAALTFAYQVQPGDFDANGITLASPLDLDSGTLTDVAGNPAALAFTLPDTAAVKIQTYTAAFATSPVTSDNANAIGITIAKAPAGASFAYTITSDGGAGSVTGTGTISGPSHSVSSIDVSNLAPGTLTLSVTVSSAAGGTGAARTAQATATFTGILDGRAAPEAAFSLHRLRSAHAGPLVRVRRASDNAEQNISSVNMAGGLDTAALAAFCGSSSCFVRTWYDQSGNGRDVTNTTTSRQPRIVNAGTIESISGLPAPYFNGAGNALVTSGLLPTSTTVWSTHLAQVIGPGETGRGRVWGLDANPSLATNALGSDDYFSSSGVVSSGATANPRIVSLAVAGSGSIWVNGSLSGSAPSGIGFGGGQALVIGNLGALNRAYNGRLHTVILGTGAYPTADRQAIERWLGSLSGLAVP